MLSKRLIFLLNMKRRYYAMFGGKETYMTEVRYETGKMKMQ